MSEGDELLPQIGKQKVDGFSHEAKLDSMITDSIIEADIPLKPVEMMTPEVVEMMTPKVVEEMITPKEEVEIMTPDEVEMITPELVNEIRLAEVVTEPQEAKNDSDLELIIDLISQKTKIVANSTLRFSLRVIDKYLDVPRPNRSTSDDLELSEHDNYFGFRPSIWFESPRSSLTSIYELARSIFPALDFAEYIEPQVTESNSEFLDFENSEIIIDGDNIQDLDNNNNNTGNDSALQLDNQAEDKQNDLESLSLSEQASVEQSNVELIEEIDSKLDDNELPKKPIRVPCEEYMEYLEQREQKISTATTRSFTNLDVNDSWTERIIERYSRLSDMYTID